MKPDRQLYFDDLNVGQIFESGTHLLDAEQIKAFARQFDPQPFHLDEALAEKTLFAGLAASGWHTGSIAMRLMVETLPFVGGLIGFKVEINWPKPTRPGDILNLVCKIEELTPSRSKPDRGIVKIRCETYNQHGELLQILQPMLVVPRR